jgi:hypothetical protein
MSVAGFIDAPLDIFGGLVTDMQPGDLPLGVSPDCQDVAFAPGSVRTRSGIQPVFAAIAGNPTVNYLKTYITPAEVERMLALDSSGVLWKESAPGVLAQVTGNLPLAARAKSTTLFGREYIAISDGKFGNSMPRQFDDRFLDRVSQEGPGAGPSVADAPPEPTLVIVAAPTGAVRSNNVATITTSTAHGYRVGQTVLIAGGVIDPSFGGTFLIASVPTATSFTYANPGGDLNSGGDGTSTGGNATLLPQASPGVHQVSVIFETRQGYLTVPSPPVNWTTGGGRRAALTNIPTGPANVVARILAFTGANGATFFYVASDVPQATSMRIADNSTTSWTVDFSDAALLAAASIEGLFQQTQLGGCAGVIDFASRLFWWGERSWVDNFLNLSFDGGFESSGLTPLGWIPDSTFGGGAQESSFVNCGFAYRISGPGPAQPALRGMISQTAYLDGDGVPILAPSMNYSVRVQAAKNAALGPATLKIDFFSPATGQLALATISSSQLSTAYQEFIVPFSAATPTNIPPDAVLRIYVDFQDSPATSECVFVDDIEIFPTALPFNLSLVRASGVEDPESYDTITGILSVGESNGQALRAAFVLREQLYFVKERSLYVTQDDGVNEPARWSIHEVSRVVGTPSVNGVDVGEDWAVIAGREGLYLFSGSEPVKISQEIQPTWDQINWQAGHTLWVRVDTRNKRILCGVPLGASATSPNTVLVCDYRGLATGDELAGASSIHFSSITKKLFAFGNARKWCPWTVVANAAAAIERPDGTAQLFLGNGGGTGKIYNLSDSATSDDGAPINSYYTTSYFLPSEMEESLQVKSHRKLFGYLTAYAEGAGLLNLISFSDSGAFSHALVPLALSSPGPRDLELPINISADRVAFQTGTNAAGSWFRLQRIVPSLAADPWAMVRGS